MTIKRSDTWLPKGRILTAQDWENTGYRDGFHGNEKFPPRVGHSTSSNESVRAYLNGYSLGRQKATEA